MILSQVLRLFFLVFLSGFLEVCSGGTSEMTTSSGSGRQREWQQCVSRLCAQMLPSYGSEKQDHFRLKLTSHGIFASPSTPTVSHVNGRANGEPLPPPMSPSAPLT